MGGTCDKHGGNKKYTSKFCGKSGRKEKTWKMIE
jgi:hypothetical protein